MIKLGVPSGIGDISWLISKIINAPEWKNDLEIIVADGWPWRAQPYLDMLGVKSSYGNFRFEDIITFEKVNPYKLWSDIVNKQAGLYLMQPNWWLESGKPLADYLPDLETNYHYEMKIPEVRDKKYYSELSEGNWVGISCASYRGARAWKTWELSQWLELCKILIAEGYKLVLLGGKWDDITDTLGDELHKETVINLVGKTEFSEACAIHRLLTSYIGFSSGLGIIRTVLGLPTLMLWPEHQQALTLSWADPKDVESRRYIARPYLEPRSIFNVFKGQMEIFGGKLNE